MHLFRLLFCDNPVTNSKKMGGLDKERQKYKIPEALDFTAHKERHRETKISPSRENA